MWGMNDKMLRLFNALLVMALVSVGLDGAADRVSPDWDLSVGERSCRSFPSVQNKDCGPPPKLSRP